MREDERDQRRAMAAMGVDPGAIPEAGATDAWKRALVLGAQQRRN